MRLICIGIIFLVSCGARANQTVQAFHRNLPDTTRTWAGRMTKESYLLTRRFEDKLGLQTLSNGVGHMEVRVWALSNTYDPQVLFILKNDSSRLWRLRTLSFFKNKNDSIYADFIRLVRNSDVDSIRLNRYWALPSQSDLKAGDSFGCADGADFFIELANSSSYRFMWYSCPDLHIKSDSAFLLAYELGSRLDGLSVGVKR